MKRDIRNRIIKEAEIMINTKMTLRSLAKVINLSKSTIHKDLTKSLKIINKDLYLKVEEILMEHKETRHLIGGKSTKEKYKKLGIENGLW